LSGSWRALNIPPKVSVVIPVHNRSGLLRRAVRSVIGQTLNDLEIIVVDDGSTDDIRAALDEFRDQRLTVIRHQIRQGAAAARNTGVRCAKGSYLAFLDSDDEWLPSKLEEQLRYMQEHDGEVCCSAYYLSRDGGPPAALRPVPDANAELLFGCALGPGSTLVVTREAFSRVGPFLETLLRLEDWDWMLRCRLLYKILVFPSPLARAHFTTNPENAVRIINALNLIRARRALYGISVRTPIAMMKFQSTILMEKAGAAYRSRQTLLSLGWGMTCFAVYPFRNREFYKHRLGNLLTIVSRRPAWKSRHRFEAADRTTPAVPQELGRRD
jgi:glycosyltransferase involved in cell wall biosynthesis